MAHYALIRDNIVQQVIYVERDYEQNFNPSSDTETEKWIQTSYNTRGGVHYGPDGNPDGGVALRKNFAGVGCTYDESRDAFIYPKPFESWVLDETTCLWNAPIPEPQDEFVYKWDEETKQWLKRGVKAY